MIFNFLKYLNPTWYYNLAPEIDWTYFPSPDQLEEKHLKFDLNYTSQEAKERDLAYVLFRAGYINRNRQQRGKNIWEPVCFPPEDEYRFIRKNVSIIWVYYVFVVRILSFHNPFKELKSLISTRSVKKVDYSKKTIDHSGYDKFESQLVKSNPLVTVVIPTLNRYPYLKDVLKDLEAQSYKNFEVIVVDQSEPFRNEFFHGWNLNLRYWYQEEKALWRARNEAIEAAKGDYVLLYDDDSRVDANWIYHHLKTMDYFSSDLSSGVSISLVGSKVPAHYSYFRWSDQLDTGNVLMKKEVFKNIGLFDRSFEGQRMGDGEFGLRAYLAGFRNVSNPKAKRLHLKVGSGGLRQMGSWDGWRPKKFFGPRPVPSILYFFRKYFGNKAAIFAIMRNLPPSIVPYRFKRSRSMQILGSILSLLIFPVVITQVLWSWNLASHLLNQNKSNEN